MAVRYVTRGPTMDLIGEAMDAELRDLLQEPCSHLVRLGDSATQVHIKEFVTINVAFL